MIANAATSSTGNRSSRPSITVLYPVPERAARVLPRPERTAKKGLFAGVLATLRMAVGNDDESEDYECLR